MLEGVLQVLWFLPLGVVLGVPFKRQMSKPNVMEHFFCLLFFIVSRKVFLL